MIHARRGRNEQHGLSFRAVADPTRRAILDGLVSGPRHVNEIATEFSMSRPAVSKHLRLLRRAALVTERRAGRRRVYQLNPRPLREIDRWLGRYRLFWSARLLDLKEFVESGRRENPEGKGRA